MRKFYYTIFLTLFITYSLYAGGFKLGMQGLKQIGMAHTGVGYAQDGATIYFNPAGMSFIKDQFQFGIHALMPSTSYLDKSTEVQTTAISQVFTPLSMYGKINLSKKIQFGFGVYTPFGSGLLYPEEWTGRYILHSIELQTIFFQPTLSYKLGENFAIGAGIIYATGHVNLQKDIPVQGENYKVPRAELSGNAKGWGSNVGAYYKGRKVNLGITYHSNVTMKVEKGNVKFINMPTSLQQNFPLNNTFKSKLKLPSELAIGLGIHLAKNTVLALDWNYTFWKSFDSLGFDYEINTPTLKDDPSPRLYKNAMAFRAGLSHQISKKTTMRLGAFYDRTPIQNGYVSPELPDNNKLGLTAGLAFKITERFSCDFSLLYENVPKRTQKNLESGLEGTFKTKVIAPGVGFTQLLTKRTYKRKRY